MRNEKHALTVMTRLAARKPEQLRLLDHALRRRLSTQAPMAVEVAAETGGPIGKVLAKLLQEQGTVELAKTLRERLPSSTTALREVAVEVERRHLSGIRTSGRSGAIESALALSQLALRLVDIGRTDDALSAAQDAVELCRKLGAPASYTEEISRCLNTLSYVLARNGRALEALESAREYVAIARENYQREPESFAEDLAVATHNLSIRLAENGLHNEALRAAQESVDLNGEIRGSRTEEERARVALSLITLSNRLSTAGLRNEALAALRQGIPLYRDLAEDNPDAYRPALAAALNTEASTLLKGADSQEGAPDTESLRKAEEALAEAESMWRHMADERPGVFSASLAMALGNQGYVALNVEDFSRAIRLAEESIALIRPLASEEPDVYRNRMSRSYWTLGNALQKEERSREALAALEKGMTLLTPDFLVFPSVSASLMANLAKDYASCIDDESSHSALWWRIGGLIKTIVEQMPPDPAHPLIHEEEPARRAPSSNQEDRSFMFNFPGLGGEAVVELYRVLFEDCLDAAGRYPEEPALLEVSASLALAGVELGFAAKNTEDAAVACQALEELYHAHPGDDYLRHELAVALRNATKYHSEAGNEVDARSYFERLLELAQREDAGPAVREHLAQASFQTIASIGDFEFGQRVYSRLSRLATTYQDEASLQQCLGKTIHNIVVRFGANETIGLSLLPRLRDMVRRFPSEPVLRWCLAEVGRAFLRDLHLATQDFDAAKQSFEELKVLALRYPAESDIPENFGDAFGMYIIALVDNDLAVVAQAAYQEFLSRFPGTRAYRKIKATCALPLIGAYARSGDLGQARALYEEVAQVVESQPDEEVLPSVQAVAGLRLIRSYLRSGRKEEAQQIIASIENNRPVMSRFLELQQASASSR